MMQEYFNREIKTLERELAALKTSMLKSAGVIETRSKSVTVDIPLSVNGSVAKGRVKIKIVTASEAMVFATLDKYYDDIMKSMEEYETRSRNTQLIETSEGLFVVVTAFGTLDDVIAIAGGGTVSVSSTVTIQCTANFEMEVVE